LIGFFAITCSIRDSSSPNGDVSLSHAMGQRGFPQFWSKQQRSVAREGIH
jgi:hypothetical protein